MKFEGILRIINGQLYRWVADYNQPINRPFFDRLIGRLIGIGRTLALLDPHMASILPYKSSLLDTLIRN